MNIKLEDSYLGNFTPYKKQDIITLLSECYQIFPKQLSVYNNAMDNTVIDIDNQYILKIYETKSVEFVKNSLDALIYFNKFYPLEIQKSKNDELICYIYSKPSLVYKKIHGTSSNNLLMLSNHLATFHKCSFLSHIELNIPLLLDELSEKINFYFNHNVKRELQKKNRLNIYELLIKELYSQSYYINMHTQLLPYGFIHGDYSPSNVIKCNSQFHFLDFDSLHKDFQLWDLIDLLLKYTPYPCIAKELKTMHLYTKNTGFYKNTTLSYLYCLINLIASYKGIIMALSTEYYCFEKGKFTLEVMNSFFLKRVLHIISNVRFRLENL